MRQRARHKRLVTAVRTLLLTEWDPIGIGDEPAAQTEYDSYALTLAGLLMERADQDRLSTTLAWARGEMGLPADADRDAEVVRRLLSAYHQAAADPSPAHDDSRE